MSKLFLTLIMVLQLGSAFSQRLAPASVKSTEYNSFNAFDLRSDFEQTDLFGHLYVYSTPDSTITAEDIIRKSPDFKLIDRAVPDLGNDNRFHWIQFQVFNSSAGNKELISYLHLNEVDDVCFYVVNERGRVIYRQQHLDNNTLIIDKVIPNQFFAFPFSINPREKLSVYWRISRENGRLVFPLRLYSKQSFFYFTNVYNFLAYLSYGVLGFTFLLGGILYFVTRYKLLFYYAGYCLFYLLLCFSNEGIFKQYAFMKIPFINENMRAVLSGTLLYFILTFSEYFLQIRSYMASWFVNFTSWLSYACLLYVLISLIIPMSEVLISILSILVLLTLLSILSMIIYGMFKRKIEAYIYFVAISTFFANSIWLSLIMLFGVPASWFYYEVILYQTIIEFVILGIGLGYQLVKDRNSYLQRLNLLQRNFTTSILGAQDSERERIASDLHDDLGGTIATIRLRVSDIKSGSVSPETIRKINDLEPLIKKTGDDLRRISHNLMPPEFVRIGLLSSLKQLVESIPASPTKFEFLTAGIEKKLTTDIELNIYRIVSELVQNTLKHAQAKHASVQVLFFEDELRILVEDNGLGTAPVKSQNSLSGMGIKNCILRANYMGAKLTREVSPAGTFVVLDVPYSSTSYEPYVSD